MRITFIVLLLATTCPAQDLTVLVGKTYVGFDEDHTFAHDSLTDKGDELERIHWTILADSGHISYTDVQTKVNSYRKLRDKLLTRCELKLYDNIFSPCFVLGKYGDEYPLDSYYDLDGTRFKINTPSELVSLLLFQLRIKDSFFKSHNAGIFGSGWVSGLISIKRDSHSTYFYRKYEVDYYGTKNIRFQATVKESYKWRVIQFNEETFPPTNKTALNRTHTNNVLKDGKYDVKTETIIYRDDEQEKIRYLKFLHNNTYLNLDKEIRKIEIKINDVQNTK